MAEESKYTVDYFIKKFEAIPSFRWTTGKTTEYFGFRRCAIGHCIQFTKYSQQSLHNLFYINLGPHITVAGVNDHGTEKYCNIETPKERILAALHDIKKKLDNTEKT